MSTSRVSMAPAQNCQNTISVAPNDSAGPNEINWLKIAIRLQTYISSAALGVLTALVQGSITVSPIGWGLAATTLGISLVAATVLGGPKELFTHLGIGICGFAFFWSWVTAPVQSSLSIAAHNPSLFNWSLISLVGWHTFGAPLLGVLADTIADDHLPDLNPLKW